MNHAKIFLSVITQTIWKAVVFSFEGCIFEEKYKSTPGILQMNPKNIFASKYLYVKNIRKSINTILLLILYIIYLQS